ncbi:MAG: ABC transporter ATP-binding protein [Peptococcaceae bacterium]|jgi:spermidine/putrescine transport system ATP-binding protein|nr:ABC transporter ATP-binding protein [Peptococcaceae bacterium]
MKQSADRQILIRDVCKEYDGEIALDHFELYVRKGEFLTLLGPSGCGKTTTLRILGGFEFPSSGRVWMEGQDITGMPPHKRKINTIFQKYALFPHMNVFDNIAFGLKVQKKTRKEIDSKVGEMLELVGLTGYGKRNIEQLSGGQQQRVAIARALANEPRVLLLDEPLGALDLKLRKEMHIELKRMQQRLGITFVYVTHDQEEALTMSDTIVVMRKGKIQQIGTPLDIYNEPKNVFVAEFIGESNILPGVMHEDCLVSFSGRRFPCVDRGFARDEPVDVVIRPEDIQLVAPEEGMISGEVLNVVFMGVHYEMQIQSGPFVFLVQSTMKEEKGRSVGMKVPPDGIHIMRKDALS